MEAIARDWLALQCRMISGVHQGAVIGGPDTGHDGLPGIHWPEERSPGSDLIEVAQAAMDNRRAAVRGAARSVGNDGHRRQFIAFPVLLDDRVLGAVALETPARSEAEQRATLQLLQWGVAWLAMLYQRQTALASPQLSAVLESVTTALEHPGYGAAATALATELAARLGCERVSIGMLKGKSVQVRALSHSAQFSERTNLMRDLAAAMEEAIEQSSTIVRPSADRDSLLVSRRHEQLVTTHGDTAVCTVPYGTDGELSGAITLERTGGEGFDAATTTLCEQIASLVGPILDLKASDDRSLPGKIAHALRERLAQLLGPGHLGLKLGAGLAVLAIAVPSLVSTTYRVTGDAVLEGIVQRSVVAPQDGFVGSAERRAGDVVSAGDLLASLDDRELRLEYLKWSSQLEQLRKEYRSALASGDRAQVSVLRAQMDQAEAQTLLLEEQLARTRLIAPFDGFVVTGDLSQSLGSPVSRGDVLFEVAPLDGFRIALNVDERHIALVEEGQSGRLALTGLPGETMAFVVNRVTPVAAVTGGQNRFRLEADIQGPTPNLRPGMQGVGKIEIGPRRLIWVWTHDAISWLRLLLWKWFA
jgi:multidrug resistance efflux pump